MRGIRGIYFRSESRLDPETAQGRKRALAIHQANSHLDIIQPWLSAGRTTRIAAPRTAQARVDAWQSIRGRATLVSVVWTTATTQYCPDPGPDPSVSLLLPGVTDVDHVLLLSTAGMSPLPANPVAGGVEVSVPLTLHTALLLVTRDAAIVRELADRLNGATQTLAQLTAERIDMELAEEQFHGRELARDAAQMPALETLRDEFRRALGQQDHVQCDRVANDLLRRLARRRFHDWASLSSRYGSPVACPLATQPGTRRWLAQLQACTSSGNTGLNLLAAGDCDTIQRVKQAGWQLVVAESRRDVTSAVVVSDEKHGGTGCMRLQADASSRTAHADGRPWIWANTPATTIPAGQIIRIDGWTKYESAESTPGLLIFDSLAGPNCGLRIGPSGGWQPFTLYRAAELDTPATLTFALTGPGRVWIDDLTISLMQSTETLRADVLASGRQYTPDGR